MNSLQSLKTEQSRRSSQTNAGRRQYTITRRANTYPYYRNKINSEKLYNKKSKMPTRFRNSDETFAIRRSLEITKTPNFADLPITEKDAISSVTNKMADEIRHERGIIIGKDNTISTITQTENLNKRKLQITIDFLQGKKSLDNINNELREILDNPPNSGNPNTPDQEYKAVFLKILDETRPIDADAHDSESRHVNKLLQETIKLKKRNNIAKQTIIGRLELQGEEPELENSVNILISRFDALKQTATAIKVGELNAEIALLKRRIMTIQNHISEAKSSLSLMHHSGSKDHQTYLKTEGLINSALSD